MLPLFRASNIASGMRTYGVTLMAAPPSSVRELREAVRYLGKTFGRWRAHDRTPGYNCLNCHSSEIMCHLLPGTLSPEDIAGCQSSQRAWCSPPEQAAEPQSTVEHVTRLLHGHTHRTSSRAMYGGSSSLPTVPDLLVRRYDFRVDGTNITYP